MKRVTGLGGIFFKANDPKKLREWYRDHLGFKITDWGASFIWGNPNDKTLQSRTEWSPFKSDADYFAPSKQPYMINYRVHDLTKLLEELKKEGVMLAGEPQEFEYGKFGWIMDPEDRKIELWEPVDDKFGDNPVLWTDRVTGIGGVFFKSENSKKTREWYVKHLGVGDATFRWNDLSNPNEKVLAHTIWSPFKNDTNYFDPSEKPFMFNYRVRNLEALMKILSDEGVTIVGKIELYPYGKFGWIMDPEGNKVELWEPIDDGFGD